MCGIVILLQGPEDGGNRVKAALDRISHRGPDASSVLVLARHGRHFVGHNRLSIQGQHLTEPQPIVRDGCVLSANAEIYNAETLTASEDPVSDCDAILDALKGCETVQAYVHALQKLDGIFSFVLVKTNEVIFARSRFGIMPLFVGRDGDGLVLCSERKCFPGLHLDVVLPGTFAVVPLQNPTDYKLHLFDAKLSEQPAARECLSEATFRQLFFAAVEKRLRTIADGVDFGFLLSGGLDSSAVVAAARHLHPKLKIKTFCIGLPGSPDMEAARLVAQHLGTDHHEYVFTVAEGLSAVPAVVRALETVDTTTVRAGTPMWLLGQHIHQDFPDLKVLFSGEGADELLMGYLCFHEGESLEALQEYSLYLLDRLHQFDVQRAHFALIAHSIETRVPFLDRDFVDYCLDLHPAFKAPTCRQEKYWLRRMVKDLLPPTIVKRVKEQFSDGVGYAWIDALRDGAWCDWDDTKEEDRGAKEQDLQRYKKATGREQLNVFHLFETQLGAKAFEDACKSMHTWKPGFGGCEDPSGRVAAVHPDRLI